MNLNIIVYFLDAPVAAFVSKLDAIDFVKHQAKTYGFVPNEDLTIGTRTNPQILSMITPETSS